jgi:phosphoesterase RecJ-like protein
MHTAFDKQTIARLREAVGGSLPSDVVGGGVSARQSIHNLDPKAVARLEEMVGAAHRIVITCHFVPDGDAIGSSLGLARVLRATGRHVTVIPPDETPKTLSFLPGFEKLMPYSRYGEVAVNRFRNADLVICLDFNASKRVDQLEHVLLDCKAPKVMIDHHESPENFVDLMISHPESSSTSILVYDVLRAMGLDCYIDAEAADCLLTGMMTDTGNFTYNANNPAIYLAVADLVAHGADRVRLCKLIFDTFSESCLRLNGYALSQKMRVFKEHKAAYIALTRDELNSYHYSKGDTEGLVNKPLAIPGVVYSAYFREEKDYVKVSMRSVGAFRVDLLCEEHFGGGGHKNAAGGEFRGTMEQCIATFEALMPFNLEKYTEV